MPEPHNNQKAGLALGWTLAIAGLGAATLSTAQAERLAPKIGEILTVTDPKVENRTRIQGATGRCTTLS